MTASTPIQKRSLRPLGARRAHEGANQNPTYASGWAASTMISTRRQTSHVLLAPTESTTKAARLDPPSARSYAAAVRRARSSQPDSVVATSHPCARRSCTAGKLNNTRPATEASAPESRAGANAPVTRSHCRRLEPAAQGRERQGSTVLVTQGQLLQRVLDLLRRPQDRLSHRPPLHHPCDHAARRDRRRAAAEAGMRTQAREPASGNERSCSPPIGSDPSAIPTCPHGPDTTDAAGLTLFPRGTRGSLVGELGAGCWGSLKESAMLWANSRPAIALAISS